MTTEPTERRESPDADADPLREPVSFRVDVDVPAASREDHATLTGAIGRAVRDVFGDDVWILVRRLNAPTTPPPTADAEEPQNA